MGDIVALGGFNVTLWPWYDRDGQVSNIAFMQQKDVKNELLSFQKPVLELKMKQSHLVLFNARQE